MPASTRSSAPCRGRSRVVSSLKDDAEVEVELLFVEALDDLSSPHVKLLDIIGRPSEPPPANNRTIWDVDNAHGRIHLQAIAPELSRSLPALLGTLAAHGLIEDVTERGFGSAIVGGGRPTPQWRLTESGRDLLVRMFDLGDANVS